MAATTSFSTWDFYNNRVSQEARGGQFVSAETTLIAAGPPSISDASYAQGGNLDTTVYPIGLLESFGIQQNKQLQRIFEIGSSRSYFVPGRVVGSLSLGRTLYFGPSLLRVIYAYYNTPVKGAAAATAPGTEIAETATSPARQDPKAALISLTAAKYVPNHTAGYDYFWVNLASDLFSQPTGMAVYFKDFASNTVGAFYLQECYVQGHQLNVSSGSVLIMEGAQLQYDLMVPIKMI